MKRFAFVVLVFAAAAIAEEEGVKEWAENFETNIETVQMCLEDAGATEAEMQDVMKKLDKVQDDIDDETKKFFEKHNRFIACMLEKKEMMKDSKLVVDKIIEALEKEKDKFPLNMEDVKECLNAVNEDSKISREDRAMGMTFCIYVNNESKEKKK